MSIAQYLRWFALVILVVGGNVALVPAQTLRIVPILDPRQLPTKDKGPTADDQQDAARQASRARAEQARKMRQEQKLEQQIQRMIQQFQCNRRPSAAIKVWATPLVKEAEGEADHRADEETARADHQGPAETAEGADFDLFSEGPPSMSIRIIDGRPVPVAEMPGQGEAISGEAANKLSELGQLLTKLGRHITLGEWSDVKGLLAGMESKEHSTALYLRILDSLAENAPQSAAVANMTGGDAEQQAMLMAMMQQARPAAQHHSETNLITIPDLVGLVQAAPCELDNALPKLGRVLRASLAAGNVIDELIAQLLAEVPLMPKRDAAKMLSAAGQDERLEDFLPTIEEAQEANDREGLNLLSRYFLAKNQQDPKTEYVEQAWHVTQAVLAVGEVSKKDKEEAMRRAVELVPKVKEELSQAWMNESFRERPERGKEVLAAIGGACGQAMQRYVYQAPQRQRLLEMQSTAVQLLLDTSTEQSASWQDALNLLAQNWMREAQVSLRYDESTSQGPSMRRDPYGNIYYLDRDRMDNYERRNPRQPQPIPTGVVLETRPQDGWHELLEPGIQSKFDMTYSQLFLKVNEPEQAFPYIERMATTYPQRAKELAEEFLRVWAKNHNPNAERDRTSYYMFNWGYSNRAERIPLTRSKQNRNLVELAKWAARLKQLPFDDWDEGLLVNAFMTSHSDAEVFQLSAIENVFGSIDNLQPETLASFAQRMRASLATLWRDPNVQKQNNTNRKQKDIQREVARGYETAADVVENGLAAYPDSWQLKLSQACLAHDRNDYANELQKNAQFADRRKAAMALFADAAKLYAEAAAELSEAEQTADAYETWFYASLGAPDVGRVSEEAVLLQPEIAKIRSSILALPKPLSDHHLKLFANNMFSRMSAVNPACKFRYLREGFKIVGDHKQTQEAKKVFDYYNDLITEIKLVAEIDGPDRVGHDEPFGLFVNIRHTKEIERESGGFGRYLQNQNTNFNYYNYGRPNEDYRDKFEEAAVAALEEHFEVLSVTFNKPNVHSKAAAEYGWRVTPYAYLLLKPRGPEVDKIPPIRLDLDFLDTSGYAILPVETPHIPIDAKTERGDVTGENLEIVQTLDERQAADGKLILEIKAAARGLVPKLEQLLQVSSDGFVVTDIDDQGVSVVEFDEESDATAVKSERLWLVTMEADPTKSAARTMFAFAKPQLDDVTTSYQRFADADLVEVEPVVALERNYPRSPWTAVWCGLLFTMLGIAGGYACFDVRNRRVHHADAAYELPDKVTPFTAINLLKHIHATNGLKPGEKDQLSETIERLEAHYFNQPLEAEPDLERLMQDWIGRSVR